MKALIHRITRGKYPEQRETWADYQARSTGVSVAAMAGILIVTCLFLLAEIVGRA